MVIYMRHPVHGNKVAIAEAEAVPTKRTVGNALSWATLNRKSTNWQNLAGDRVRSL
jgi:hypothetical protein